MPQTGSDAAEMIATKAATRRQGRRVVYLVDTLRLEAEP